MGELDRAGLIDTTVKRVDSPTLAKTLDAFDIARKTVSQEAIDNAGSAPAASGRNLSLGSQETMYKELDRDRSGGCIRHL